MEYAADEMKTERRSYVSCLNCREDTAAAQFMETKRLWGKPGGRVCYHGYQSFKADEITAATAHELSLIHISLADVYRAWERAETHHMDDVRDVIEARADTVIRAEKEKGQREER